jgi:hypothetical protein
MSITPIQLLIKNSFSYKEYPNPVAYDPKHNVSYGYWICKKCSTASIWSQAPYHKQGCLINGNSSAPSSNQSSDLIYVLGENEDGIFSPFKKEDIKKIKELAKSKFSIMPGNS